MFDKLFSEGRIGAMRLKNRIAMAPMGTYLAANGAVTEELIDYYVARARGGAGLIVVEAAYPRPAGYLPNRLWISEDRIVPGLARLTAAVHKAGAKIVLQVNSRRGREDAVDPVSASGVPVNKHYRWTGLTPRVLTIKDIEELVGEFTDSIPRVARGGFDGVLLHGGHGYIISEFLSSYTNRRSDKYGGSLENRARLPLEFVAEIRKALGRDFPLIVRLSADDRGVGGFVLRDAVAFSQMLEKAGIDCLDIVSGMLESYEWSVPPGCVPPGYNVPLAGAIKKEVKIPVMVAGRINTPELAEKTLLDGMADFVSLGRELLADPDFPQKAREGRVEDIRSCIACDECTNTKPREKRNIMHLLCTVNPAVGREPDFHVAEAAKKKKVLVIGGGAAGMQAAVTAAERGHDVTLWEKGPELGGQLLLAVIPPNKSDINNLVKYLSIQMHKHGVRVLLNHEATLESVSAFGADAVVVAVGSTPLVPDIPGMDSPNVVTAHEVLRQDVSLGQNVVVIGGGLVGCETAEFLADKGKSVTVIARSDVATEVAVYERWFLLPRLASKNVRTMIKTKTKAITASGVVVVKEDGTETQIAADNIVLAVGAEPCRELYNELKSHGLPVSAIGDCNQGSRIMDAIHDGAAAGMAL